MQEMKTKLDVMEIRQQLGQGPGTASDVPKLPVLPMNMFGMGGPLTLPMSMNNVAQNTVKNTKLKNLAAINQMQDLLQELTVDQDLSETFSPNLSIGATSQLSLALQKSDFGSQHEVQTLLKEKKYFELLQKSLRALAEIQKGEVNRSRFSDLMGSTMMLDSPKRGLGDSLVLDKTLYPSMRESASMLELKLQNAESVQLRDADNGSTLSREDFDENDENVIRFEEQYESEDPTEGDVLTFYKTRKKRVADRSGGPLPEMPQKEKVAPLKPPIILSKDDIRKNVQLTKALPRHIESLVTLNENLEAVTEQDNEDKSTPRTNFSSKTPPVPNTELVQPEQTKERGKETPLQEYHPKQSNPNAQLDDDTESLDFAPVGKVKESSIKKDQIIPKFSDADLAISKEASLSNSKSARGL